MYNQIIIIFHFSVFNTAVDIKLKQWAEKQLPQKCVQVRNLEESLVNLILLLYLNFQPLEVVSRYRDPQPQVAENYSY